VHASIIICTHNRADLLRQTLPEVCRQQCAGAQFEVVVIDNASTDRTRQVVEEVRETLQFPIKYYLEPQLGLSSARNAGVEQAAGDILIFTDDDAIPQPGWLENIIKPFADQSVVATGGDVEPVWPEGAPPVWLHPYLQDYLGIIRFYLAAGTELSYPRFPFGVNIAFRKSAVREAGGFSASLGRSGNSLLSGEETELCIRLANAGRKIVYAPGAVVRHIMAQGRISKAWFRKRSDIQGVSKAVIEYDGISFAKGLCLLFYRMAILLGSASGFALCTLAGQTRLAFFCECKMRMSWTYLRRGSQLLLAPGSA